jgi:hypothetical protein
MRDQLIGLFIIWSMAVFSQIDKLFSKDIIKTSKFTVLKKQRVIFLTKNHIAVLIISIATLSLFWKVYQTYQSHQLLEVVSDANARLFNEASGGVAIGKLAYIVDDEHPYLFRFVFEEGKYRYVRKIELIENEKLLLKKMWMIWKLLPPLAMEKFI